MADVLQPQVASAATILHREWRITMRMVWQLSSLLPMLMLPVYVYGQSQGPALHWKGIQFHGLLDSCWTYNTNHPDQSTSGGRNALYNFNDKANQFNPTMAELGFTYQYQAIGVTATLIAGRANRLIRSASSHPTLNYIEQAFVSIKPGHSHGAQLDFGQFVTSAGAETIEAPEDWNYSRSLLFSLAIPYYHFGIRSTLPVTTTWTAGLQIVNGWNSVTADNGGLTLGLTSTLARPKYGWDLNVYTGPAEENGQLTYRNLIDSTLSLTPAPGFAAYLNYDYGRDRTANQVSAPGRSPQWQGFATAAREQFPHRFAAALRYEYFSDQDGFATGEAQTLQEVTVTGEHIWRNGLLSRLEYRRDWSNHNFFPRGEAGTVKTQSTVTVALIAYFGYGR